MGPLQEISSGCSPQIGPHQGPLHVVLYRSPVQVEPICGSPTWGSLPHGFLPGCHLEGGLSRVSPTEVPKMASTFGHVHLVPPVCLLQGSHPGCPHKIFPSRGPAGVPQGHPKGSSPRGTFQAARCQCAHFRGPVQEIPSRSPFQMVPTGSPYTGTLPSGPFQGSPPAGTFHRVPSICLHLGAAQRVHSRGYTPGCSHHGVSYRDRFQVDCSRGPIYLVPSSE
jgi:hypothetical protein